MKYIITEDVRRLIRQAIDENRGSKDSFCRDCGIRSYELSKILSGSKNIVIDDNWWKLYDYFPEIDNNQIGRDTVEGFRSDLIAEIIMLDIDSVAKDTVLKTIAAFKQGET